VGVAVGSAVRLCSTVSAFPFALFAPCFVVHETTGETLMNEKKSNDGAGLTRVGTALTRAFGSFSNFVVNGAASVSWEE
jgi:hypothetical protein